MPEKRIICRPPKLFPFIFQDIGIRSTNTEIRWFLPDYPTLRAEQSGVPRGVHDVFFPHALDNFRNHLTFSQKVQVNSTQPYTNITFNENQDIFL